MSEKIRIILADDHPIVRDGLRMIIETDANLEIVAEASDGAEAFSQIEEHKPSNVDFAVVRYNTNGTLDTSFSGDGKVITDFSSFNDVGNAVAIDADGKIVVAGYYSLGSTRKFAAARYNTNGSLDTSFDGDGKAQLNFVSTSEANAVTIDSNGKIILAGQAISFTGTDFDFAVVRLKQNGLYDTSFAGTGFRRIDFASKSETAYGVAVDASGKIVLAGQTIIAIRPDFALVRINSDGSFDNSFGGDGKVTTDFDSLSDTAFDVEIDDDGKIIAAGTAQIGSTSNNDFALAKYNTDGSLDTTFGGDGKVTTDFASSFDIGRAIAIDASGRIVVAGSSGDDFAVARYISLIFTVNLTNDAGDGTCDATCTLRDAITRANSNNTDDVIGFDPTVFSTPQTITLNGTELAITNNGTLTIDAAGTSGLTISGNNTSRVFTVNSGANLVINDLTVSDGKSTTTDGGGGILNKGTLTLNNTTVSNNTARAGSGISNFGSLSTTTANNTTISGNTASTVGGGIYNNSGTVILNNTTVSGNSATSLGGGIYHLGGTVTLNNSIVANSTGGDCTTSNNSTFNASYSLIEDDLNCVNGTNSNNLTGDPNLGPLQNNGGSTETHALLPGSIAIDAGNSTLTTDQRGAFRPVDDPNSPNGSGNLSDIGSFEVQAPTAASVTISGRVLSSAEGRGLPRAIIHLTDQNGNMRIVRTNSFGYYRFNDVEVGQSLILNVFHKRYQFVPQVVTINNAVENLDFIAQPSAPASKTKGLDYLFDRKFN